MLGMECRRRLRAVLVERAEARVDIEERARPVKCRVDARFDALRRWQALDGDRSATLPADKLLNAYESALASTLLRDWSRADASNPALTSTSCGLPMVW